MKRTISLEAIDFQENSPLGIDLVAAVQELRKLDRITTRDLDKSPLTNIIRKHTGLSVLPKVANGYVSKAFVSIPDINNSNPLLDSLEKSISKSLEARDRISYNGEYSGNIDLKRGKVSGDFAKAVSNLMITEDLLWSASKLTVEEVVAIILHEIGHIFVYMEMLARTTKTNYLILAATRRCLEAESKEQRIKIIREVEDEFGENLDGLEDFAAKQRSEGHYRVTFLSLAVKESVSQVGSNLYDLRSWETLADDFAVRHGFVRALAVGLNKLEGRHDKNKYVSGLGHILATFIRTASFLYLASLAALAVAPSVLATWAFIAGFIISSNPMASEYYPKPKERIGRLADGLTAQLKDKGLDPQMKKDIVAEVKAIRLIEEGMFEHWGLMEFLWKKVYPWGRKQYNIGKQQAELEKLVNNRLYEAAASLQS